MHHGAIDWKRASIAAVLASCIAGVGCSTFPHAAALTGDGRRGQEAPVAQFRAVRPNPDDAPARFTRVAATEGVLQPRTQVRWSLAASSPRDTMGGSATVGPDGTLEIGPYGHYQVAGLTVEQARAHLERQLARRVQGARFSLQADEVTAAADWTTGAPAAPAQPRPAASPPGVRSTWRPAQRVAPETMPPTLPERTNQFAAASPRAVRANVWQPAGQSGLRPVSDTGGPETGPPPRPVQPPPESVLSQPPLADGPLGPPVGPPFVSDPPHAGPPFASAPPHGPPVGLAMAPMHAPQPFGRGRAPWEGKKIALPAYVIAPPDILQIDSLEGLPTQPIRGPHLVRPDGTVGLGGYGSVFVAGMTLDQARVEIAKAVASRLDPKAVTMKAVLDGLNVDVLAYNSRMYYIITNRLGFGTIVDRLPITGNETVLDAISQLRGLPPEASKHRIWVARKTPGPGGCENKLPVDWIGITQRGEMQTNYQLLPGDRIFVQAEAIQRVDFVLSKWLSPVQRLFGSALLASETINSIRTNPAGTSASGTGVIR
jgi:polysaccharide export outer membrane protein